MDNKHNIMCKGNERPTLCMGKDTVKTGTAKIVIRIGGEHILLGPILHYRIPVYKIH